MNIFRSLIGRVWQDTNAEEVVKISSGQLYLVRPDQQVRTSRECIYNEAIATIRRVPSVEHNFQLVVTRVYEEGDEELLDDEDETDEERVFLIGEELDFHTGETDGDPTFLWRDLQGDVDDFFEFVAPGTNEPTLAFFETCMYRAMYERKYKKGAEGLSDSKLDEFIRTYVCLLLSYQLSSASELMSLLRPGITETVRRSSVGPSIDVQAQDGLVNAIGALTVEDDPPTSTAEPMVQEQTSHLPANLHLLVAHEAELYYWDMETEQFFNQGIVTAQIFQKQSDVYEFWLVATTEGSHILAHRVSPDMNQRLSHKMSSLTWNNVTERGISSWLFRFTPAAFESFKEIFMHAMWESLYQAPWEKMKVDEQNYVISSATDDVEMRDIEEEEEEEDVANELEAEASSESESEEDEEEYRDEDGKKLPPGMNTQLHVGYRGDRSFVVRGDNIGVFSHTADRGVRYEATAPTVTLEGKSFTPRQVMLHDQDAKILITDPLNPNSVYEMDTERGKIVEEWQIHDDIEVSHMAPDNKYAPTTHEQTFVGASHNALFRIDPRLSGRTKLVESQFKQYVSKNKFSGVATTASGKLAVASEKGDIRLFDTIGKNAKTALPPLGDPIIGVDATADGRWIVATTKTYLLLIDTLIGEGRYAGSLGFDRSFPATAKPIPRRLQLRGEHVAFMKHDVSFSPARFNRGQGQEENAIVTSTGQYIVAWDFSKVKKGQLDKYEIKMYEDRVIQDDFRFGDDKQIVVALSNDVLAINKTKLQKPSRKSLAPPSKHSHSDIVNQRY
ncbi:VID27-domain-containing protein [Fistulina hepatica ATCC 64428]|nr:VID27-domain-containing protein [Fistulina hepatica ATCC 64428]